MKNIKPKGKMLKGYFIFHILFLLMSLTSGCGNKFFDPSQVGRFNHTPSVNVILETLGVAEEVPVAWEQGEEPRPIDTVPNQSDYTLMSGDIIEIEIHELLSQGVTYLKNYEVSETGKISIPVVGEVSVRGQTETQLEDTIKERLTPDILVNPLVHVTLLQSQHRAYSIQGDGVNAPNRYPLPRYPLRLLEVLAEAGSANQKNVSYVYVTRQVQQNDKNVVANNNDIKDSRSILSEYNLREPVAYNPLQHKETSINSPISKVVVSSSEMVIDGDANRNTNNLNRYRFPTAGRLANKNAYQFSEMQGSNGDIENKVSVDEALKRVLGQEANTTDVQVQRQTPQQNTIQQSVPKTTSTEPSKHTEWVFQNGQWVAVEVESPSSSGTQKPQQNEVSPTKLDTDKENQDEQVEWKLEGGKWVPVPTNRTGNNTSNINGNINVPNVEDGMTWEGQETDTRLIKIPLDKLLAGDPRYNIVIKPGDSILVPLDVAGQYFLMGNLNRTGPVDMTGGMVTLKQAIATAGNLGPLAWPKRCEITRRIGRNKEEVVRVDLEKIFNGEQPDIYIKPHDVINVGTHATSIWRAALRNSFRATYGFGFTYDRNFAIDNYYSNPWFD